MRNGGSFTPMPGIAGMGGMGGSFGSLNAGGNFGIPNKNGGNLQPLTHYLGEMNTD
jgi:hypothetical protein